MSAHNNTAVLPALILMLLLAGLGGLVLRRRTN
ncbi:MAG: LPXTG cell wall anchor domain-containing protein [Chloroflexi bacterium]|nr:LPXTG cell wall anchor domain-containing protein [Chloroflexota bacterium]